MDLKKGLIDIDKVFDRVIQNQGQGLKPLMSRQEKWKAVFSYMAQNPSFLLDSLPSAPSKFANTTPM